MKLDSYHIMKMEDWIYKNARPIEVAKWNNLFNNGSKDSIVEEMLKYQNVDGGFGNGFESDILLPTSASIPSTEAIFTAYDYELDCSAKWFEELLHYFEKTIQVTPSFWEKVPKACEDYPHAPWWNYMADKEFTPNPSAVIASAFLAYGDETQKKLGNNIAIRCFEFLNSKEICSDHDCYCLLRLLKKLEELESPLINDITMKSMRRRILTCVCFDESKWMEYVAQPLDLVDNPDSKWFELVEQGIDKNFLFWINNLDENGVFIPNFSWGIDSQEARQATINWMGYVTVKKARVFKKFNLIE